MNSYPSPDGRFRIEIFPVPMRMSHEVDTLTLIDEQQAQTLFDPGSMWDAFGIEWSADSQQATMTWRHYSNGTRQFRGVLDVARLYGEVWFEEKLIFSGPFAELQQAMREVKEIYKLTRGW